MWVLWGLHSLHVGSSSSSVMNEEGEKERSAAERKIKRKEGGKERKRRVRERDEGGESD